MNAVEKNQEYSLLWNMTQMKDLFVKQRMWPSFVGAKDVQQTAYGNFSKGKADNASEDYLLPILLWPEQKRYLASKGFHNYGSGSSGSGSKSSSSETKRKGKRKRGADGDENNEEDGNNKDGDAADDDDAVKAAAAEAAPPAKRARNNGGFFAGIASVFSKITKFILPRKRLTNEEVQLAVFGDCQERGYFVGPGHVYGGDYNIYRGGDPSNSHSTATVRVVRRRTISGRDLLSFSRVQNQVAKSAVLAYVDNGEPKFLVANFQNVSERL
jgi:tRNA splicing endonuclease